SPLPACGETSARKARRVRGTLRRLSSWRQPLTPALSPRRKGRGSAPRPLLPPKTPAAPGPTTRRSIACAGREAAQYPPSRPRFEHQSPGAKVIRLERNYRSTGHILAAASYLIAHNEGRLGKTLRTEDVDGEKVTVTGAWDSEEEARAIGEEIEDLQRAGEKLNEIAILVRASYQMRELEDRFVTPGLPYRVIGGPRLS